MLSPILHMGKLYKIKITYVNILKYGNEENFIKCCLTRFYIKLKQKKHIWIITM